MNFVQEKIIADVAHLSAFDEVGRLDIRIEGNTLTINQREDITKKQMTLSALRGNENTEGTIQALYFDGEWKPFENSKNGASVVKFDITKPHFNKVKITTSNGLFDDIVLNVACKLADADAYYKKIADQKKAERAAQQSALNESIKPFVAAGSTSINIFWANVSEDVAYSIVDITFLTSLGKPYLPRYAAGSFKVDGTPSFTYTNPAFGTYEIIIREFDKDGDEIACSNPQVTSFARRY